MAKRTDEEIYVLVDDLISKMTLEEKIGQLQLRGVGATLDLGVLENESVTEDVKSGRVGVILQSAKGDAKVRYELQKMAVEETRLGIPLLFNAPATKTIPLAAPQTFPVPPIPPPNASESRNNTSSSIPILSANTHTTACAQLHPFL